MNKKILVSLFFIFSFFFSFSQLDYQSVNKHLVGQNQRPPQDTIIAPLWIGEIRVKISNDTPYMYICVSKTASKKWDLVKGQGNSGTGSDLGTSYNTSSIQITNSGGTNATINEASTTQAGVLSSGDKVKLNRLEPFKDLPQLRQVTNLDTSVFYIVKERTYYKEFYYDPNDITSTDDSASVIVTTGGARLKRMFRGIYRPEDFGANGYDAIDDYWAFQKMINYIDNNISENTGTGKITLDGKARYIISEGNVVLIPKLSINSILVIEGNGARIEGNTIFRRRPPSAESLDWQGLKVDITNITFERSGTLTGSIAVDLGSTYQALVEKCNFINFDTALVFRFGLQSTSRNNMFTNVRNIGLIFTYGSIWGGGLNTTQSNGSVSDQDRFFMMLNSFAGIVIEAASDCRVRDVIVEGSSGQYGIYYDTRGITVAKGFAVNGAHIEMSPAPSRAAFYHRGDGYAKYEEIYVQVVDTFMVVNQTASLEVQLNNIPFLPTSTRFASVSSGTRFRFDHVAPDLGTRLDTLFVNSGIYSTPTTIEILNYKTSSIKRINNQWGIYNFGDTKKIDFIPATSQLRLDGIDLRWLTDNSRDIGTSTTSRPRNIYSGTAFVAPENTTTGGFRFGLSSGEGFANPSEQVIHLSNSTGRMTGAFGLPTGTTAQRPALPAIGYLRHNSDSSAVGAGIEIYLSSYKTIASADQVRDSSNNIRTWANAKFLNNDLVGSATLNFGSVAAGAKEDLTITVIGAAVGDKVILGAPNLPANGMYSAVVTATDTITVRFINNDLTAPIDPDSGIFKVTVLK